MDFGVVTTPVQEEHGQRLKMIYDRITGIMRIHKPEAVAIETIYHSKNLRSFVLVYEAIGVIALAAAHRGVRVEKFTPLEVKSAIVGFGRATKDQVQLMIMNMLNLGSPPKPNHASDALAVAICYKNLYC